MLFGSNPERKNNPVLRDPFTGAKTFLTHSLSRQSISSSLGLYDLRGQMRDERQQSRQLQWRLFTPAELDCSPVGRASAAGHVSQLSSIMICWVSRCPDECNESALMHLSAQHHYKPLLEGRSQISGSLRRWAAYCCFWLAGADFWPPSPRLKNQQKKREKGKVL